MKHVRHCHRCQVYADQIKAPPNELRPMTAPWPFSMWGMDVIGPINPKASNGHMFILMAIDYFTKWIEAVTLASVTAKAVARFLIRDVIARYGIPATIITDNAKNLNNKVIDELCAQFKIRHRNSTPYRPQMNGAVEAANKNIKKIIEKMTVNYKDWHEMLPYALLTYWTSIRTSTGATPYSLVYGMEAVLPIKVEIPSMRIIAETELEEAEWAKQRYEQLNFIDEKRLKALSRTVLPTKNGSRLQRKSLPPRLQPRRPRFEESPTRHAGLSREAKVRGQFRLDHERIATPLREAAPSSGSAFSNASKLSSTLQARDSPWNGVESTCDQEPQRMLPADGFASASCGKPCSRGLGNRRGMRRTAQTNDVQKRTSDKRSSIVAAHEAIRIQMPSEPYLTTLCANSKFRIPSGPSRLLNSSSGLSWPLESIPAFNFQFRSILAPRVHPNF
ncbi:hypothetical protein CRG98_019356 [Punica granatum]|uniref:Integrase catalytic domain-containing protein n=1 Tax=Punica granatum TaxID=22663 RepID=A0A2I0JVD9_PUNGR|nr:hypothetical protein CRG98_019356 [Punica granatum]